MVEKNENIVDLTFLDAKDEKLKYTVLIILNRPLIREFYFRIREISDFIMCADGAANRIYDIMDKNDQSGIEKMIPNCIVGDFDSIRSEVQEFYSKKNVKMFMKQDQDTTDLEKCLYVSLEKISEIQVELESESIINYNYYSNVNSSNKKNSSECDNYQNNYENFKKKKKKFSIIILGASGGRIDHTFSAYSQVYKYLNMYSYEFCDTEILMMSKSSCSVYLKPGKNVVFLTKTWEKKNQGFSIIPLFGEGKLTIYENEEKEEYKNEKLIKFGEYFYFRKVHKANVLFIYLEPTRDNSSFIFTFTTVYHDYN